MQNQKKYFGLCLLKVNKIIQHIYVVKLKFFFDVSLYSQTYNPLMSCSNNIVTESTGNFLSGSDEPITSEPIIAEPIIAEPIIAPTDISRCDFVIFSPDVWRGNIAEIAQREEKLLCIADPPLMLYKQQPVTPELTQILNSGLTGERFLILKSMTIHEALNIMDTYDRFGGCVFAPDMCQNFRLFDVGKRVLVLNFRT